MLLDSAPVETNDEDVDQLQICPRQHLLLGAQASGFVRMQHNKHAVRRQWNRESQQLTGWKFMLCFFLSLSFLSLLKLLELIASSQLPSLSGVAQKNYMNILERVVQKGETCRSSLLFFFFFFPNSLNLVFPLESKQWIDWIFIFVASSVLNSFFLRVINKKKRVERTWNLPVVLCAPLGEEMSPDNFWRSKPSALMAQWKTLTVTRSLCKPQCKLNVPSDKHRFRLFRWRYGTCCPNIMKEESAAAPKHWATFWFSVIYTNISLVCLLLICL